MPLVSPTYLAAPLRALWRPISGSRCDVFDVHGRRTAPKGNAPRYNTPPTILTIKKYREVGRNNAWPLTFAGGLGNNFGIVFNINNVFSAEEKSTCLA